MATGFDPGIECSAYTNFEKEFQILWEDNSKSFKELLAAERESRVSGEDKDGRHKRSRLYRDTLMKAVEIWKKYVQNILKDIVEIVIKCISKQVDQGATLNPFAEQMLKKCIPFPITGVGKEIKLEHLQSFKETLIAKCSHDVLPIFCEKGGIDEQFQNIFEPDRSLSSMITDNSPVCFAYWNIDDKKNEEVELATSESFDALLRLFYGVSCVFKGENKDEIFQQGVLSRFPERRKFRELIGQSPGDLLFIMFKYAKRYGPTAWLYYHNLLNLGRFIQAMAFDLVRAIRKWVCDVFGEIIWDFTPTNVAIVEIDHEYLEDDMTDHSGP